MAEEPNVVAVLIATLDRDNKQIDDLRATIQHRQTQLAYAREQLTTREREHSEYLATLEPLIDQLKGRLTRVLSILRRVAKVGALYHWGEDRALHGGLTALIADEIAAVNAEGWPEDVAEPVAGPGPHSVVTHMPFGAMPLLEGERLVLGQIARAITWDGALASKAARDSLFEKGLLIRVGGWNSLSAEGLRRAIAEGIIRG